MFTKSFYTHKLTKRQMDERSSLSTIVILVIVLLGTIIVFSSGRANLKKEIEILKVQITEKEEQLINLGANLKEVEKEKRTIEGTAEQLETEKNELSENYDGLRVEAYNILAEVEMFEGRIVDSLNWFNTNSNIDNVLDYSGMQIELRKNCMNLENRECQIRLSCLPFINEEENGFSYLNDTELGKEDFMQDLKSIFENKGGDCEDISLLTNAEINYLKDECNNQKEEYQHITFIGYEEAKGQKHFIENKEDYFIKDAKDYKFELKHNYIVCGNLPLKPWETKIIPKESWLIGGHCLLAFSDTSLSNGIKESMNNALLIEPQTGEVMFDMRRDKVIQIPENEYVEGSFVYLIFDEYDMYLFDLFEQEYKWVSYSELLDKLSESKTKLKQALFE